MDPDNLPESDPSKMDFSSGSSKPKSWKEIWGSGQGIAAIKRVIGAAELVDKLEAEYLEARQRLGLGIREAAE
jgi:nitronate monooxygenase